MEPWLHIRGGLWIPGWRWETTTSADGTHTDVQTGGGVVAPPSVVWASITISSTISWHHPGIHRHHTVCRHGSTPRVAHGSLNLRASPIHGQAASQAAASTVKSSALFTASIHTTHGWHLRLTESHPRDLEHSRHTPVRTHQQIRRTWPPHVLRSFRRSSGPPLPKKANISPQVDTVLPCPRRARRLIYETAIVPACLRCAKNAPNEGPGAFCRLTVSSL